MHKPCIFCLKIEKKTIISPDSHLQRAPNALFCKSIVNNLLFKHNVTIIDFIGVYTRAAWHNFASELFGT